MSEQKRGLSGAPEQAEDAEVSQEMLPEFSADAKTAAREPETPEPASETAPTDWEAALAAARAEERARCEAERDARIAEAVAAERVQYERLVRENALSQALEELGISPSFAPLLLGNNAEEDDGRLNRFLSLFRAELSRAVAERMRGTEVPRAPEAPKGYDRAALRAMSAKEINEQWAEISAAMGQQ